MYKIRQPVSANSDFFYTPVYRHYFGMTPPNPRLHNPRLMEDYIDWYMNVYLEEELPWQWVRKRSYNVEYVNISWFCIFRLALAR